MRRDILVVMLVTLSGAMSLAAQVPGREKPLIVIDGVVQTDRDQPPPGRPGPAQGQEEPFARFFFPPELVMQHQGEIALTDAQRSTLTTAMQQAQSKFIDTQFKLSAEAEKLSRLVQGTSIDEAQALEQVDRILALERDLKRAQTGLLVRIKNTLTPSQQAKLSQLRQPR
ncbi:MAG: periplasmic heavy metal sensor [bacterium]